MTITSCQWPLRALLVIPTAVLAVILAGSLG